jgi:hypothetical protein
VTIRSETVANLAIALMCLVVSYAVADRFIAPKFYAADATQTSGYRVGDLLTTETEELRLAPSRVSAVIVLSNSCRFCIESADFYRKLARLAGETPDGAFQAIYLGMSGQEDADAFATTHNLPRTQVRSSPMDILSRVPGTPALLLVDGAGRVTGSWVGKLNATQEATVLAAVSAALKGN